MNDVEPLDDEAKIDQLDMTIKALSLKDSKKKQPVFSDDLTVTLTERKKPRIHSENFFYLKDKEGKESIDKDGNKIKIHYFKCEKHQCTGRLHVEFDIKSETYRKPVKRTQEHNHLPNCERSQCLLIKHKRNF